MKFYPEPSKVNDSPEVVNAPEFEKLPANSTFALPPPMSKSALALIVKSPSISKVL